MKKVIKRNGKINKFKFKKLKKSILKAGESTGEFGKKEAKSLAVKVRVLLQDMIEDKVVASEEIAEVVEEVLMNKYKHTAKDFILYRDQQQRHREISIKEQIKLVNQYLEKEDWKVKENSNITFSLSAMNNYISSEVSRNYWLNNIYPKNIRDAHLSGDYHINDLNLITNYCMGHDLYDLLTVGFKGVRGKIESKPAKHFRTALGQMVNFIFTLANESAGAQAFSNVDTLLSPFIYYDKLGYKEVKQAIQEFVFNMNVPTRTSAQCPFSNITLDLTVSPNFKNQAVIIGGKTKKKVYGDFQKEMDLFNKAFFDVMMEGDANGRVFSFPLPNVNITKDFNWNTPNLEGLWKITGKYGIPTFSNFVNSDMSPEQTRSLCCRLRLSVDKLEKRGGGLFGANSKTGSLGVVTLNMSRLGYLSKDREEFLEKLDHLMFLAKESLEIKRKVLEKFTEQGLYPYTKFYMRDVKEKFGEYWKNHFSTIGLIGMNEAMLNLIGEDIGSYNGKRFSCRVLNYMRDKLISFQKETGNLFNLEQSPGEGASHSLAVKDKEKYKNIVCANEENYRKGAAAYYSNSTHLPVNYTDDLIEALDLQDELNSKYTGGCIHHIFVGEKIDDCESVKQLVKKVCENYTLPYFTITPTFSVCRQHSYLPGEQPKCPHCGEKCEVWSRVVGYLRPVEQWHEGKQGEFSDRKTYKLENKNG